MSRIPKSRAVLWRLGLVLTVCIVAALVLISITRPKRSFQLSDGSVLKVLGFSHGTNAFETGSRLEKLLGDRIPAKGLEVLGWNLDRPRLFGPDFQEAPIIVWVEFTPSQPQPPAQLFGAPFYKVPAPWNDWRIVAANGSGRAFENPSPHAIRWISQDFVLALPLYAFPRDQRTIHLKMFLAPQSNKEPEVIEFEVANPLRRKLKQWVADSVPQTNTIDDLQVVLAEVRAAPTQIKFWLSSKDWRLLECSLVDEEENVRFQPKLLPTDAANFVRAEFEHGLELHRNWKVEATFVRAPGYPKVRDFNFPENERITLQVTRDGKEVAFTNRRGTTYVCRLRNTQFVIREVNGSKRPHFVVLGATDDSGESVLIQGESRIWFKTYGFQGFIGPTQLWHVKTAATNLTVHLACPKVVTTEFYVGPDSR